MRVLAALLLAASAAQASPRPVAPRAKAPAAGALGAYRLPSVPASLPAAPLAPTAPSGVLPALPHASVPAVSLPPQAAARKPAALERTPLPDQKAQPSLTRRTRRLSAALKGGRKRAGGVSSALTAFFDGGVPDLALMGQEGADILRGLRSRALEAVQQARGGSLEDLSSLAGEVGDWILKSQELRAEGLPAWLGGREHPEAPGSLARRLHEALAKLNAALKAVRLPSAAAKKILPLEAGRVRVVAERRKRTLADVQVLRAGLITSKAGDLRHVGAYHEGTELRVLARVAELATPRQLAAVLLHEELARAGLPHDEVARRVLELTGAAFGREKAVSDEELTKLALRAYPRLSEEAVAKLGGIGKRRRKTPAASDEVPFADDLKSLYVQDIRTQGGLAGPKVTSLQFAAKKLRYLELIIHEGRVWLTRKGAQQFPEDFVVMPQDGYDADFLQTERDGTEIRHMAASTFVSVVLPALRGALQRHLDAMNLTYGLRMPVMNFMDEVKTLLRGLGAPVPDKPESGAPGDPIRPEGGGKRNGPADALFGPVRLGSLRLDESSDKEGRAALFFKDPDGRRVELRIVTKSAGKSGSGGLYSAAYEDMTYRDPGEDAQKREIWLFWKDVSDKDWRRAEIVSDLEGAGVGDDSGADTRRVSAGRFRDEYLDYFQEAVRARMGRASEDGAAAAGFMVRFRKVLAVIEGEEGV